MAKLSRTSRYKELRDQLDEETTKAQALPDQPLQMPRIPQSPSSNSALQSIRNMNSGKQTDVLDELLGEVKQYNIDQGERVIDDTQFNILETLNEPQDVSEKRALHIQPMEKNTNSGGTTMNIERMDINSIPASASESQFLSRSNIQAEQTINPDNLQVFDIGAEDFDRTIRQSTPKPVQKQKRKERKSQSRPSSTQSIAMKQEETAPKPKKGSAGWINILLGILIVLLLIAIGFTVYLIFQAGIL